MQSDAPAEAMLQCLRFRCAATTLGILLHQVCELLEYQPLTPFPTMPAPLCGLLNLRGNAVPVIDLAQRLGLPATVPQRRSCIIILQLALPLQIRELGMLVDEVLMVEDIQRQDIEAAPPLEPLMSTGMLAGMIRETTGFTLLLDANHLLSHHTLGRLAQDLTASSTDPACGADDD
ncbi:chemotaxis protein CheW [Aquitalea sp. LB_tupeE]|uniref:chemotaxis protein CheW n=1 Tax=Aquitalea sp. LB_tupeE TaxID=2748078 RepID=UPI0015BC3079|nr:chemotaxis protein CheW [Aquitalea sp. LB_tupeE]NWK77039.1 purine-binding chemotaxis protein CheW [Aquitalea sp. LB_tupeE]